MNEFLAQLYDTAEAEEEIEKTAEAQLLDELEKVAAAEGIDLNELSDDEIVEILQDALGEDGEIKEASAGEDPEDVELTEEDQEKLAEADFLGRVMAHAMYDELSEIGEYVEKTAGDPAPHASSTVKKKHTLKYFMSKGGPKMPGMPSEGKVPQGGKGTDKTSADDMVVARAEEILEAALEAMGEEKTSADDDAITYAALELLDNNDYDVDAIVDLLDN